MASDGKLLVTIMEIKPDETTGAVARLRAAPDDLIRCFAWYPVPTTGGNFRHGI
jgi:hypothetical protein